MHPNYPGSPQPGHYPPQQGYPPQYPPQQDYPSYVPQYPPQGYSSGPTQYPPQDPFNSVAYSPQGYSALQNSGGPGYPPQGYSALQNSGGYAGQPGYPPQGQPGYPQPYPPQSPGAYGQPGYPPQNQQAYPTQGYFNAPPQVKTVKNRCTVNYSKTMGITTGFFEKGSSPSLKGFPTYQMELHYVDEIFQGKTQPWNRKYDKAQQIYGPGITSSVLRKTITTQHAYLYRSTDQNEFHEIGDVHELLNLLARGRKDGLVVFYTYVIINGTWRFSQTGPSTVKDMFSKHACHANCAESVTYSGEFHFQEVRERNTMKLIIDNNSGTFGPDKNDLPKVAELFRRNFPGLEVEALDYADPILKGYLERAKAHNALVARGGNNPSPY